MKHHTAVLRFTGFFFNMYAIKISSKPIVISKTFPFIKTPGALRRCIRNYYRTLWPALIDVECFRERVISLVSIIAKSFRPPQCLPFICN